MSHRQELWMNIALKKQKNHYDRIIIAVVGNTPDIQPE